MVDCETEVMAHCKAILLVLVIMTLYLLGLLTMHQDKISSVLSRI